MMVTLIAAMSRDGTIGDQGKIPWHCSEDLRRFKQVTMGFPIIMGRKTYESIGKSLPGRENMILTRSKNFEAPAGASKFSSLKEALAYCHKKNVRQAFIIGGAEIYRQALPLADRFLLTRIDRDITGDTKFPPYDPSRWREVSRVQGEECTFIEYIRQYHG